MFAVTITSKLTHKQIKIVPLPLSKRISSAHPFKLLFNYETIAELFQMHVENFYNLLTSSE